MNKVSVRTICIILISIASLASYVAYRHFSKSPWQRSLWHQYAYLKLGKPPRNIVKKALQSIQGPGIAIDFGSGVGNETLYLLKKGYTIIAIDAEKKALELMRSRDDIQPYLPHLTTLLSSFEKIDWLALPKVDLFVASFSLPFVKPEFFKEVWHHIVQQIKPGGYFVGHFFTPKYTGFKKAQRKAMTFLDKQQIDTLFDGFTIEYLNFEDKAGQSATGVPIEARYYEIIAQKNPKGNHL